MTLSLVEKRRRFRALHDGPEAFVMPNPWDIGSALYLASLGFQALATTSAGFAFSIGKPDAIGSVTRDEALAHFAAIAAATDLPVNADFEGGFADDPAGVATNVALAVDTGVAGLSIEDATGNPARPFHEMSLAVERIRAARQAIDSRGGAVLLTGRAEAFLHGHPDPLRDVLVRLPAFAEAGADVLYAPGLQTAGQISQVVRAVAPKPVNVLRSGPGLSVHELEDLGVRRISVGGALARAAWAGFARAATAIAESGQFSELRNAMPHQELNDFFLRARM